MAQRVLPDCVVSKIADPAERKRQGGTAAEAIAKSQRGDELKEQKAFEQYLSLKFAAGLLTYTHPASNKRSTIQVGHCDFIVRARGRCIAFEFKACGGRLSPEQADFIRAELIAGNPAGVVYSAAEAIGVLRLFLANQILPERFEHT